MVYDCLQNLKKYVSDNQFKKIQCFLDQLSPDMQEGYYEIDGDMIYAKVMSYATSLREECRIEAHDQYIDVQSSLVGCEGIDIYHRGQLQISEEYSIENDVAFFSESVEPFIQVRNVPGYFSMIYPKEAHKPQISLDKTRRKVKKFVIKIHC